MTTTYDRTAALKADALPEAFVPTRSIILVTFLVGLARVAEHLRMFRILILPVRGTVVFFQKLFSERKQFTSATITVMPAHLIPVISVAFMIPIVR